MKIYCSKRQNSIYDVLDSLVGKDTWVKILSPARSVYYVRILDKTDNEYVYNVISGGAVDNPMDYFEGNAAVIDNFINYNMNCTCRGSIRSFGIFHPYTPVEYIDTRDLTHKLEETKLEL